MKASINISKNALCVLSALMLGLLSIGQAHAQSVIYANGNPGDWTDNATNDPATVTTVATGGPGGVGYTQINNVDDEYLPGYGSGPYSLFGTGITTAPSQSFYQSVDVYIDTAWDAPT